MSCPAYDQKMNVGCIGCGQCDLDKKECSEYEPEYEKDNYDDDELEELINIHSKY